MTLLCECFGFFLNPVVLFSNFLMPEVAHPIYSSQKRQIKILFFDEFQLDTENDHPLGALRLKRDIIVSLLNGIRLHRD